MKDIDALLEKILSQESTLQFERFSIEMAHEIGSILFHKALEEKLPVAIDITRNGHQLYHISLEGSSPDNDAWIKRKMNVVNRFSHSSYYMGMFLEKKGSTMEETYLLDSSTYAAHGGSFPIIIRGTGIVGTITVSGLLSKDDHEMVVSVLSRYLKKN